MRDIISMERKDVMDAARMLGGIFPTFTARDFLGLAMIQHHELEEEDVNDQLLELVKAGCLREVGPAVYAVVFEEGAA
jgi:hypothetical protein